MKQPIPRLTTLLLFGICLGCGSGERVGEDYGDLSSSPSGLILTEGIHPDGWGRPDCLVCHTMQNIHFDDPSIPPGIDMAEVRDIAWRYGEAGCWQCHGDNGAGSVGTNFYRVGVR